MMLVDVAHMQYIAVAKSSRLSICTLLYCFKHYFRLCNGDSKGD